MKALEIQGAIYQRLIDYTPLASRVTAVYDDVPEDKEFPYIVIGDDTAVPFDTDTSLGSEATITIHTWSRYPGKREVKEIQGALYDALVRYPLEVSGAVTLDLMPDYQSVLLETGGRAEDGETRHGISRFRLLISDFS